MLKHVLGYLKRVLTPDEITELHKTIERYHKGLIPLVVPVTPINLYAYRFEEPYPKKQCYLAPHPLEQMLRSHL